MLNLGSTYIDDEYRNWLQIRFYSKLCYHHSPYRYRPPSKTLYVRKYIRLTEPFIKYTVLNVYKMSYMYSNNLTSPLIRKYIFNVK